MPHVRAAIRSSRRTRYRASADQLAQKKKKAVASFMPPSSVITFEDKRPEVQAQRKRQAMIENSPRVAALRALQQKADARSRRLQAQMSKIASRSGSAPMQRKEPGKENITLLRRRILRGDRDLTAAQLMVLIQGKDPKPAVLAASQLADRAPRLTDADLAHDIWTTAFWSELISWDARPHLWRASYAMAELYSTDELDGWCTMIYGKGSKPRYNTLGRCALLLGHAKARGNKNFSKRHLEAIRWASIAPSRDVRSEAIEALALAGEARTLLEHTQGLTKGVTKPVREQIAKNISGLAGDLRSIARRFKAEIAKVKDASKRKRIAFNYPQFARLTELPKRQKITETLAGHVSVLARFVRTGKGASSAQRALIAFEQSLQAKDFSRGHFPLAKSNIDKGFIQTLRVFVTAADRSTQRKAAEALLETAPHGINEAQLSEILKHRPSPGASTLMKALVHSKDPAVREWAANKLGSTAKKLLRWKQEGKLTSAIDEAKQKQSREAVKRLQGGLEAAVDALGTSDLDALNDTLKWEAAEKRDQPWKKPDRALIHLAAKLLFMAFERAKDVRIQQRAAAILLERQGELNDPHFTAYAKAMKTTLEHAYEEGQIKDADPNAAAEQAKILNGMKLKAAALRAQAGNHERYRDHYKDKAAFILNLDTASLFFWAVARECLITAVSMGATQVLTKLIVSDNLRRAGSLSQALLRNAKPIAEVTVGLVTATLRQDFAGFLRGLIEGEIEDKINAELIEKGIVKEGSEFVKGVFAFIGILETAVTDAREDMAKKAVIAVRKKITIADAKEALGFFSELWGNHKDLMKYWQAAQAEEARREISLNAAKALDILREDSGPIMDRARREHAITAWTKAK